MANFEGVDKEIINGVSGDPMEEVKESRKNIEQFMVASSVNAMKKLLANNSKFIENVPEEHWDELFKQLGQMANENSNIFKGITEFVAIENAGMELVGKDVRGEFIRLPNPLLEIEVSFEIPGVARARRLMDLCGISDEAFAQVKESIYKIDSQVVRDLDDIKLNIAAYYNVFGGEDVSSFSQDIDVELIHEITQILKQAYLKGSPIEVSFNDDGVLVDDIFFKFEDFIKNNDEEISDRYLKLEVKGEKNELKYELDEYLQDLINRVDNKEQRVTDNLILDIFYRQNEFAEKYGFSDLNKVFNKRFAQIEEGVEADIPLKEILVDVNKEYSVDDLIYRYRHSNLDQEALDIYLEVIEYRSELLLKLLEVN